MIDTKELRRLAQEATPGPWKMLPVGDGRQKFAVAGSEFLSILTVTDEGGATFGTVYDDADAKFIAAANPATVSELLDRLEAAEKERDNANAAAVGIAPQAETLQAERDTLRAKIEAMEKQEPVAWTTKLALEYGASTLGFQVSGLNMWGEKGVPLYALPGAQSAQSVPDTYAAGINAVAAMLQAKAAEYAREHGHDDTGVLSFGPGMGGEIKMDYYTNLIELVDDVRAMLAVPDPEAKP